MRQMLVKTAMMAALGFGTSSIGWGQVITKPESKTLDSKSRLPKVPTVDSMIRPRQSVEVTLQKTPEESAYESAAVLTESRNRTTWTGAEGEKSETPWSVQNANWSPARFHTNPLYFEQDSLERFEPTSPAWAQPAISYAQFLGTFPVLPYKMGAHSPRERKFSIGHYPEGQRIHRSRDVGNIRRGILFQSVATTGLIFVIP
jgi:hypothetical protein